jgi:hypothetical protein
MCVEILKEKKEYFLIKVLNFMYIILIQMMYLKYYVCIRKVFENTNIVFQ